MLAVGALVAGLLAAMRDIHQSGLIQGRLEVHNALDPQLTIARANAATYKRALDETNGQIKDKADADSAQIATTTAALTVAQRRTAADHDIVTRLAAALKPGDECSRVREVDARFVGSLAK